MAKTRKTDNVVAITENPRRRGRPKKTQPAPMPAAAPPALTLEPTNARAIRLPDPEGALSLLEELAELNDRAKAAKSRYDELKEQTKHAREKYEQLADQVLTKLHAGTHASDLPLFNQAEREADHAAMMAAGDAILDPPVEPLEAVPDEIDVVPTDPFMGEIAPEDVPGVDSGIF